MRINDPEKYFAITKPELKMETIILIAAFSIAIRSFAGTILPTEWRTTTILFLFPAIGASVGKATGGILADRLGAKRVAVFSLAAAAILLTFGHSDPWLFLAGIILFNMNMSVTLCAISSVLPLNPGLTFGITTLALLCGNVPTFFFSAPNASVIFAIFTVVSAICMYSILNERSKRNEGAENKQYGV